MTKLNNTKTVSKKKKNGLSQKEVRSFQSLVYKHYHTHGRHELPWRKNMTPYRIVVSELMLQQTQVDRVIPKYIAFVKAFPTFKKLAQASTKEVLSLWQGLGYNRRAIGLHKLAQTIVHDYTGRFPKDYDTLLTLPYIGPATASALMLFAFDTKALYLETNVRSIYIHHFFPKQKKVSDAELLPLIDHTFDDANPRAWGSALLDYGTYLKKQLPNPSRKSTHHTTQSRFKGSNRQVRGAILRTLLEIPHLTCAGLSRLIEKDREVVKKNLDRMIGEGLVVKKGVRYSVE